MGKADNAAWRNLGRNPSGRLLFSHIAASIVAHVR